MRGFRSKGIKAVVLVSILLLIPAFSFVTVQGQNHSEYSLVCQAWFPYVYTSTGQPVTAKADVWGDVTFFNTSSYSNVEIILNGNLIVASGGSLTLTNVTLRVNCSSDGEHRIEVQSGGALYINDTDGIPSTRDDASNITSYVPGNNFIFQVKSGAEFQMNNSELHYCGYNNIYIERSGLWINTNNTIVENNLFENNEDGIIFYYSDHNIVRNNNFSNNNWYGLLLGDSWYNDISGNKAINNFRDGFRLYWSSYNNLTGNTAINNLDGFSLSQSNYNNLMGNIVSWDGLSYTTPDGFFLFSSEYNNLTDNIVSNNNPNDIDYGYWLYINSHNNNLTNNTSINNYCGFKLSNNSNNNILYANEAINSEVMAYSISDCVGNDLTDSVESNYLRIRVIEMFGSPVSGVDVRLDVDGVTMYNLVTGDDGFTDWVPVVYEVYSGLTPSKTLVEVWASEVGYRIVDMSSSHTETFVKDGSLLLLVFLAESQGSQSFSTLLVISGFFSVALVGIVFAVYVLRKKYLVQ